MEAEGQLKVADAYAVSTAAGLKAEAQAKAQADHFRNSQVDVNKQADAYLRLGAAQAAVSSSQAVAGMKQQADDAAKLTIADRDGAEARSEEHTAELQSIMRISSA